MSTRPALPWRELVTWALFGTIVISAWVLFDVNRSGRVLLNFIQPGEQGPSVDLIHRDFPTIELPDGLGLDGQQFYAIARNPTHPTEVAPLLDRPRYRLQRPLLSWLAWAVHPNGGGDGLVLAFLVVGVAAIFLGSLATGALAVQLGGHPAMAALFALTPGAWFSLRATGCDALALALAIGALAFAARGRTRWAIVCAVGAVLAKEVIIVVLIGWTLWRRTRDAVALTVIPAAVALAWWVTLHVMLPGQEKVGELVAPGVGWKDAWVELWWHGHERVGMAAAIASAVVGIAALVRHRLSHPLSWAVLASLALALVDNGDVIGNNYGSTRTLMPLLVLGAIALLTPGQPVRRDTSSEHSPTGIDGPGRVSTASSNR